MSFDRKINLHLLLTFFVYSLFFGSVLAAVSRKTKGDPKDKRQLAKINTPNLVEIKLTKFLIDNFEKSYLSNLFCVCVRQNQQQLRLPSASSPEQATFDEQLSIIVQTPQLFRSIINSSPSKKMLLGKLLVLKDEISQVKSEENKGKISNYTNGKLTVSPGQSLSVPNDSTRSISIPNSNKILEKKQSSEPTVEDISDEENDEEEDDFTRIVFARNLSDDEEDGNGNPDKNKDPDTKGKKKPQNSSNGNNDGSNKEGDGKGSDGGGDNKDVDFLGLKIPLPIFIVGCVLSVLLILAIIGLLIRRSQHTSTVVVIA